jgi:hypothetical protein
VFGNRETDEIDTLRTFFVRMAGKATPFAWTHPMSGRAAAYRFDAHEGSVTFVNHGDVAISSITLTPPPDVAERECIARFVSRLFPRFEVGRDVDVYLRRWTLLRTPWGKLLLHQFLRSDADKCLHDHPWRFVTLILAGGYHEVLPNGTRWRSPGTLLSRPAKFRHRVVIDRPSWSLVGVGQ